MSLQDGVAFCEFHTNAPDLFKNSFVNLAGLDRYGIGVFSHGTYLYLGDAEMDMGPTSRGIFYHATFGGNLSFWQFGRTAGLGDGWDAGSLHDLHISWAEIQTFPNDPALDRYAVTALYAENDDSVAHNIEPHLLVIRMGELGFDVFD